MFIFQVDKVAVRAVKYVNECGTRGWFSLSQGLDVYKRQGLPFGGTRREIFNTGRAEYGGSNQYNAYELSAQPGEFNGFPFWTEICVPPLSCVSVSSTPLDVYKRQLPTSPRPP